MLFGSWEQEGKLTHSHFMGRERKLENATGREGNGKFEACNPGNPGNHIKSKVRFNISFIFMPWPAIRQTANNNSISRLNSRPKIPFPGNGKGNYKMPREGKGNLRLVFPGITGNGNSRSPLTYHLQSPPSLPSDSAMFKFLWHRLDGIVGRWPDREIFCVNF